MTMRLCVASLFLLTALCPVFSTEVSQTPAASPNQMVRQALETMQKLTSYKARADLVVGSRKARIEAEVGVGKAAMSTLGFDGKRSRNVLSNEASFVSADDGKTWQKDAEGYGAVRYNFIGGPLDPSVKLHEQGEWKVVGKETLDGVATVHLRLGAQSPIDIWVAEDPVLGKYVRRMHLVIEGTDGEIDNTVTYFDLNKPVNVQIPK